MIFTLQHSLINTFEYLKIMLKQVGKLLENTLPTIKYILSIYPPPTRYLNYPTLNAKNAANLFFRDQKTEDIHMLNL